MALTRIAAEERAEKTKQKREEKRQLALEGREIDGD